MLPCKNDRKYRKGVFQTNLEEHQKVVNNLHPPPKQNYTIKVRKQCNSTTNKSAITSHTSRENHILYGQGPNDSNRRKQVWETIWTRRSQWVMNRDEGSYKHVYDDVIQYGCFQNHRGSCPVRIIESHNRFVVVSGKPQIWKWYEENAKPKRIPKLYIIIIYMKYFFSQAICTTHSLKWSNKIWLLGAGLCLRQFCHPMKNSYTNTLFWLHNTQWKH